MVVYQRFKAMNYYKVLLFSLLVFSYSSLRAQNCSCLVLETIKDTVYNNNTHITVRVKNNCMRRVWFYTTGFWINAEQEQGATHTSHIHKLRTDLPEFIQFRWKEEKLLHFTTENEHTGKINISYENKEHIYPSRLFGAKTYLCETDVETK